MQDRSFAYDEGYAAGVEFHMGSGHRADNPYFYDEDSEYYEDWEAGFTLAGEDS